MSDDELIIRLNTLAQSLEGDNQETVVDAAERIDELLGQLQDAEDEAEGAKVDLAAMEADEDLAGPLYTAIVERRTEDAVELLRKMIPGNDYMDARGYANLFPERIK